MSRSGFVCGVVLSGLVALSAFAQKKDEPKKQGTCTIHPFQIAAGKLKVEEKSFTLDLEFKGTVKSSPRDKTQKFKPDVALKAYLVWRKAGDSLWTKVPIDDKTFELLPAELTCGDTKRIDKKFTTDALSAVGEAGSKLEYELHLFATSSSCTMKPAHEYVKFTIDFAKKGPRPGRAQVAHYRTWKDKSGAVHLESSESGYGWLDDATGTPSEHPKDAPAKPHK